MGGGGGGGLCYYYYSSLSLNFRKYGDTYVLLSAMSAAAILYRPPSLPIPVPHSWPGTYLALCVLCLVVDVADDDLRNLDQCDDERPKRYRP